LNEREKGTAQISCSYASYCPLEAPFGPVLGRWYPIVLSALAEKKNLRFNGFMKLYPGLGPKTLSRILKGLEELGYVKRRIITDKTPPVVIYQLTTDGLQLHMSVKDLFLQISSRADKSKCEVLCVGSNCPLLRPVRINRRRDDSLLSTSESREVILKDVENFAQSSSWLNVCSSSGGIQVGLNMAFKSLKDVLDRKKRGKHKGVKWILNISKENAGLVRMLLEFGVQVRHLDVVPMNFAVTDKGFRTTLASLEGVDVVENMLASESPVLVDHFNNLFEQLWRNATNALTELSAVNQAHRPDRLETIKDPRAALDYAIQLVKSATKELRIFLSSEKALFRLAKTNALQSLEGAARKGVKVKVIVPTGYEKVDDEMSRIRAKFPDIAFRIIDPFLRTRYSMLIMDSDVCIGNELKDETRNNTFEAAGPSLVFRNKLLISAHIAIFDGLWNQALP
jgi:DNA-binding HxlR family transcriptional regulator